MIIRYLICIVLCGVLWFFNSKEINRAINRRMPSEVFIHVGIGLFFSIIIIEWTIGVFKYWVGLDIIWIKMIGFILFIPCVYLVWTSHEILKRKGRPGEGKLDATTVFVRSGIYRVVRHPMTLGMAIWTVALIIIFQSLVSLILGLVCIACFWLSAVKEEEHNISKFGIPYKNYVKKVPMWNIVKGLSKK